MELKKAIDEFMFYLEVEKNCSPNTLRSYAFDLSVLESFIRKMYDSKSLDDLCVSATRRFIQDQVITFHAKPRTLQRKISCMKTFSSFCLKEQWTTFDFMAGISPPKSDKKLPVYLKLAEVKQLFLSLEMVEPSPRSIRNELMFKLLVVTGMRRQEIVDLVWDQFDFANHTLRVHGKGNKERLVPLHPSVLPLFEHYRSTLSLHRLHGSEPAFTNRNNQAMNPRGLHRIFKFELERAGLPPRRFSLHHLRHTFATLLLQNSVQKTDLKTLQDLLGHESLATTGIYTHVDFHEKQKEVDSLTF